MSPDHAFRRGCLTTLVLLLLCAVGKAQELVDNIYVYGTVKDYVSAVKLQGVSVIVHKDDVRIATLVTDSLGRYEVNLDFDHVYKLWFMQPGKVTKQIEVDARAIPTDLRPGGFGMNVEMTLFKSLQGLDMSVLDQPIGKARYSPVDSTMSWDMEHTARMRAAISESLQRYDSLRTLEKSP